jgi:O-acetylhomoserine (thiol)-lyase
VIVVKWGGQYYRRLHHLAGKTMADHSFGIESLCLHAGHQADSATGARAVPIYQTASFLFGETAQDDAAGPPVLGNPTVLAFEARMAALEGGVAAVATASGLAAQMTTFLTLCAAGDEIVAARTLHGDSYTQLDVALRRLGITTHFVDPSRPENFAAAITPRTRAVYAEILSNPGLTVLDVEAVAAVTKAAGVPLVIDNTLASPYLCQPLAWGADIVLHSATQYIGGHGTTLGGVIVDGGEFPWDNGRFPQLVEPSPGHHGVRFVEAFGDLAFAMKARLETRRNFGPALSPFNAFLLLQGLETLPLRMERQVVSTETVAEYLLLHPRVDWVNYPGLADNPDSARADQYMRQGPGAVLCFGIHGGETAGRRFMRALKMISQVANVGDTRSLVIHPASTTHRQLSAEARQAAGVRPDMIRLSVGIETLDDILWDLDQALARAGEEEGEGE